MSPFQEPPINPDEDTNPTQSIPEVDLAHAHHGPPRWLFLLFGAMGLLFVVILIGIVSLMGQDQNEAPDPINVSGFQTVPAEMTPELVIDAPPLQGTSAVETPIVENMQPLTGITVSGNAPTLSVDEAMGILSQDLPDAEPIQDGLLYDPFTFIPDRDRNEFISYEAVQGDSINAIAERYGISPDTIAWCNDRRVVFALRPGDVLSIPPADGACYETLSTRGESINDISLDYKVTDPYKVINSPYNPNLYGLQPDTTLPGGLILFLPGGEGPIVAWNAPTEVDAATGYVTSFGAGQAGSCGRVEATGGSYWTDPLPSGTWVRGFYAGHSGIDLSAPQGTPIYAANSGPILYAGWNSWGYGNMVAIAHGAISTLYGHMSSLAVSCGQFVQAGQVIGYVGTTGNSTGPHLHFELRNASGPVNPVGSGIPGVG